jgi:hypothetical protein
VVDAIDLFTSAFFDQIISPVEASIRIAQSAEIAVVFTETVPSSYAAEGRNNGTHNDTAVKKQAAKNKNFLILGCFRIISSFGQVMA